MNDPLAPDAPLPVQPSLAGRARRLVAAVTAAAVVGSLLQAPAWAERRKPFEPPAVQKVPTVPVSKVQPAAVRRTKMPDGAHKPAPVWPKAGTAEVTVGSSAPARAGALPVRVGKPSGAARGQAPARVRVQTLDHATAIKAGVRGLLFRVGAADPGRDAAAVSTTVEYAPFRTAYGGDWASRLRLVRLPECALTAPARPDCRGTPLRSRNDPKTGTVTATVDLPAATTAAATSALVAVDAAPSGPAGDYTATSLQPSSTWSAGGNAGDFTWSYPMRTPPATGGPEPPVGLSYSAQSVDGRHAASNNQPSWVGEGFESAAGGFIERRYKSCADDMDSDSNNSRKTGDLCWATDNAVLSLAGHSGELIYNSSQGRWHLRDDDGSRVERKTGADNGDDNGEHWVVTTGDGIQYWFGLSKLPGWGSGDPVTQSAWSVPVYGNHAGEPCHASAFADSSCAQAWRWNLDYVVDVHGNSASYWYTRYTNKYARNITDSSVASYVRDGLLDHIEYGTRRDDGVDSRFSTSAPARVDFTVADRCLSNCDTHGENWPDTPWDQECTGSTCKMYSPTFWSTKRLSSVTTKIWNGSTYTGVDRWSLTHTFPDPGDGTRAGLWLSKISHTGLVGTAVSVPDVQFTGVQLANRVDTIDFAAAMNWWRISQIQYETGGTLTMLYSGPECVAKTNVPTAPASNTMRCYPVRWTPEGYNDPVTDYFHKYVVTTVYEADNTGGVVPKGSPRVVYRYDYLGDPAWHYADDDGLIEKKDKTWSVWRGYAEVAVTIGDAGEQTYTKTKYFRGMHADRAASGTRTVTVTGTGVPTVNDEDAFAGMPREVTVHNGPSGAVVSRQVYEPWQSAATASRTVNGDTVEARFTGTAATHERTVLDGNRGERVRRVRNSFDSYGMVVASDDAGDTALSGDEMCTRTTYEPRNTNAWLLSASHRTLKLALPCASASELSDLTDADVISDDRVFFDGATGFGTTPTRGLVTRTEQADAWNAGSPSYEQVSRTGYDVHGRATSFWNALDNQTSTAFTPARGGLVTQMVVTNPLGHTTTTTINPAWGMATVVVDANGKRTDLAYDGLGRFTAVWLPGRDKATQTANSTFGYQISNTVASTVRTSRLNAAGNYLTSYVFYDGLLRPRQTQSPSPSGGRLLTDVFYDTAGRQVRAHGEYYDPRAPSSTLETATDRQDVPDQTRTAYDGAGRVVASVFQPYTTERWRTTTAYGGDRVDVTPPTGGTASSMIIDALGRATALRQYRAHTPTGAHDTTSYTLNRKGQLARITDAAGNRWDYTYDLRGRPVTASDPDRGSTTSTYDAAGRLISTMDARGVKLQFGYDALDRRTAVFQTGVGTRARWYYDTVAKGQLYQSVRFVGGANYTRRILAYDDAYRPTSEAYFIPSTETGLGGDYYVGANYKVDGSISSVDYPAAGGLPLESVSYQYDATTGLPTTSDSLYNDSATSYVGRTTYDALGRVGELMLYTGLHRGYGKRVYHTYQYELETGRLTNARTDRDSVSPYVLSNVSYEYDHAGNIVEVADGATGDNQCYEYDYLRRLSQAWTPASGDCEAAPTTAGLGGPAPYRQSWTYDVTGNRLTQVDHATTPGGADATTAYTYPPAGSSRPHALTRTATTGGATATGAYTYDATGNTLTRPTASAGAQTLTWDPEGRLDTSTDGSGTTSYLYDADGNRLIRRDPTGSTLYLPGQEVRYTTATGATTCTRYYSFAGQTIASRTAAGLTWLSEDHQGTAQIALDEASQDATIRRQTPFGAPRGGPPASWPNSQGFVGGTNDNTGLTHLGAREYDPHIGRFISVDPVQDLADPQQWNGYAYSNNNPVTFSDPSGLIFGWLKKQAKGLISKAVWGSESDYDKNRDGRITAGDQLEGLTGCDKPVGGVGGGARGKACQGARDAADFAGDITPYNNFLGCVGDGRKSDCAGLAVDVVLSATPAAVGVAIKGLIKAVKAARAARAAAATAKAAGKAGRAADDAGKAAADAGKATGGGGKAAGGGGKAGGGGGARGGGGDGPVGCPTRFNSFAAGTRVVLADGTAKAIEDVDVNDQVAATDPESGRTKGARVTQLHVNRDTELTDVAVVATKASPRPLATPESRFFGPPAPPVLVHTTAEHPFWDQTARAWVPAAALTVGHELRTADGGRVTVVGVRTFRGSQTMYNLTVADIHTYYVLAGTTPVLVHNCGDTPSGVGCNCAPATGAGPNVPPIRAEGPWTLGDIGRGAHGLRPNHLGDRIEIHHADQMPGSPIHELDQVVHRGPGSQLHPNASNQGVTGAMRAEDTQLHWWYRSQEQGWGHYGPDLWYDNWPG